MGAHRKSRDSGPGIHEQGTEPLPPPLDTDPSDALVFKPPQPLNVDWDDDSPAGGYDSGHIEGYLRRRIQEDLIEAGRTPPRPWRSALIGTVAVLLALIIGLVWGHAMTDTATALQTGRSARVVVSPGPTITAPGPIVYRTRQAPAVVKPGPKVTVTRTLPPAPAAPAVTITATHTAAGPTATVTATEEIETCYRVRAGEIVAEIDCPE
jgi:hypothetical protein